MMAKAKRCCACRQLLDEPGIPAPPDIDGFGGDYCDRCYVDSVLAALEGHPGAIEALRNALEAQQMQVLLAIYDDRAAEAQQGGQ